jgi:hypothetical protein
MLAVGATYQHIYDEIGLVLMASQTAMVLEILHALVGNQRPRTYAYAFRGPTRRGLRGPDSVREAVW